MSLDPQQHLSESFNGPWLTLTSADANKYVRGRFAERKVFVAEPSSQFYSVRFSHCKPSKLLSCSNYLSGGEMSLLEMVGCLELTVAFLLRTLLWPGLAWSPPFVLDSPLQLCPLPFWSPLPLLCHSPVSLSIASQLFSKEAPWELWPFLFHPCFSGAQNSAWHVEGAQSILIE